MAKMSTVTAEADLYARMRRCAAAELGPEADEALFATPEERKRVLDIYDQGLAALEK